MVAILSDDDLLKDQWHHDFHLLQTIHEGVLTQRTRRTIELLNQVEAVGGIVLLGIPHSMRQIEAVEKDLQVTTSWKHQSEADIKTSLVISDDDHITLSGISGCESDKAAIVLDMIMQQGVGVSVPASGKELRKKRIPEVGLN